MRATAIALLCAVAVADFVSIKSPEDPTEIVIKTRTEPFVFKHESSMQKEHHLYPSGVTHSHYGSPIFTLKTGEAWFSLPDVTKLEMPQPGVPYAVIAVNYDIIDVATNKSVPLNEMYSHHWLVYDRLVGSDGFNIGCGGPDTWVSNIYGAGGEMRGVPYTYPEGFGHIIPEDRHWSANMHFIRTEDLSTNYFNGSIGAATKSCIECEYAPGKGPACVPDLGGSGIYACCFDGVRCPVNNPSDDTTKGYQLVYDITWTTDVAAIRPLKTYVLDVFNCFILENLKRNRNTTTTTCDDKMCVSKVTRKMPVSGEIHWAYTHQHNGAINATLSINGVPACTSYPHIGHDPHDKVGDEKGYLVGFRMCVDPALDKPIKVKKGDVLDLTALVSVDEADERNLPIPGGEHTGFMGLFYFFFHEDGDADTFWCDSGKCVPHAGGVSLGTCQQACGPVLDDMHV